MTGFKTRRLMVYFGYDIMLDMEASLCFGVGPRPATLTPRGAVRDWALYIGLSWNWLPRLVRVDFGALRLWDAVNSAHWTGRSQEIIGLSWPHSFYWTSRYAKQRGHPIRMAA